MSKSNIAFYSMVYFAIKAAVMSRSSTSSDFSLEVYVQTGDTSKGSWECQYTSINSVQNFSAYIFCLIHLHSRKNEFGVKHDFEMVEMMWKSVYN